MIVLQSIVVTALALCGAVRDALHHASPHLSLQGIAEHGQGGANAGYAALLTTLHVTGVAISGSSRSLDDAHDAGVIALYTICSPHDSFTNITHQTPCPNLTLPVSTVTPYTGTKELAVYDDRRQLAVYDRGPRDLVVYAPAIDPVQVMVNTRLHMLAFALRPLHQDDTHLFRSYLDRRGFLQAVVGTVQDPVDRMLAVAYKRAFIPALLNPQPRRHLAIGDSQRRPEESGARVLAFLHMAGMLLSLGCLLWNHWLERSQLSTPQPADKPSEVEEPGLAQLVPSLPDELLEECMAQDGCELLIRDIDTIMSIPDVPHSFHASTRLAWHPFPNALHPAIYDISGAGAAAWQLHSDYAHIATASALQPLSLTETELGPEPKPARTRKRTKRGRRSRK